MYVQVLIGNREWMSLNGVEVVESVEGLTQDSERQGKTVVLVAIDGEVYLLYCTVHVCM